jgi:hypothetical protein
MEASVFGLLHLHFLLHPKACSIMEASAEASSFISDCNSLICKVKFYLEAYKYYKKPIWIKLV